MGTYNQDLVLVVLARCISYAPKVAIIAVVAYLCMKDRAWVFARTL